ncbi:MAG: molybdate ABC transporter substrate-binding protein [Crocinitomicaceae bacterium]|nr:molybdate ABC transporter substrate-binding protein [Crocinitomicaceae bacterium]
MRNLTLVLLTIVLLWGCIDSKKGTTLRIAAAANMQFAMDSIAGLFHEQYRINCEVSSNSSGMLTAQIEKGAPYDVFVSADIRYPKRLVENGFGSSPEVYAYGSLVFVYSKKLQYNSVEEALNSDIIKRVAIADKRTAPYGLAAMEYLERSNQYQEHISKIVFGESVGQVNQYLKTKSVDAIFTSASFKSKCREDYKYLDIDPKYFSEIKQGMLLLKHGEEQHPEESALFMNYLKTEHCQNILKHFGYLVK